MQTIFEMLALRIGFLLLTLPASMQAARILAIFPFPGPSQYINVVPYLKELANRGHQVTSVNAFPQKKPVANFRDVFIPDVFNNYKGKIDDKNILVCNTFSVTQFCNNL